MHPLAYLLQVSVLLLTLSLGYYLLLRQLTFFQANRLLLWGGLAVALLLPLIDLPEQYNYYFGKVTQRFELPNRMIQGLQSRIADIKPALKRRLPEQPQVTITFPDQRTYPALLTKPATTPIPWMELLMGLYALVVVGLLIRFLTQVRSLWRLIDRSLQEEYEDFTLVKNEAVSSPFSFFSWVVLNPTQHTADERDQILRHERVHVRQWHSLDTLAAEFLCILFWFNPAVWLFRRLVHQTLEYIADRAVLQEGIDARAYQYHLVKVTLSTNASTIPNHFNHKHLKARITMINKQQSRWYDWVKYPLLLLITLTVASAFIQPKVNAFTKAIPPLSQHPFVHAVTIAAPPLPIEQPKNKSLNAVKPTIGIDSAKNNKPLTDTAPVSPSRYLHYQGKQLYWLVTPKTSFDDFVVIKQELAKYGYKLQLNEVKYDPLYAYLNRVEVSVIFPTGGNTRVDQSAETNKPIASCMGYVSFASNIGEGGTGMVSHNTRSELPESLLKTAEAEEAEAEAFFKSHKMEYMVDAGKTLIPGFGSINITKLQQYFTNNPNTKRSCLLVQPDGSLQVRPELTDLPIYINNKPATRESVAALKLNQLFTVIIREKGDETGRNPTPKGLLLYINED